MDSFKNTVIFIIIVKIITRIVLLVLIIIGIIYAGERLDRAYIKSVVKEVIESAE